MKRLFFLALVAGSLVALSTASSIATTGETTQRVNLSSSGVKGNAEAWFPQISGNARFVAFTSEASNLVAGDTNGTKDIFLRDRATGQTRRVSVSSSGAQGNGWADRCSISSDGRYVAFNSWASNLVSGDTNGTYDVFLHDTANSSTRRISVSSSGGQANGMSEYPSISSDGRYVAFSSTATNLVEGDTNGTKDVFVHDTVSGVTQRISNGSFAEDPEISGDGRLVVFEQDAQLRVHDRNTGTTVSIPGGGYDYDAAISNDGRYIAFSRLPNDSECAETRVYDRVTGAMEVHDVDERSWYSYPQLTPDGRYLGFISTNQLLPQDDNWTVDIYLRDRTTGQLKMISVTESGGVGSGGRTGGTFYFSISSDGRHVAFQCDHTNLVPPIESDGNYDVFVRTPADFSVPSTTAKVDSTTRQSGWCSTDATVTLEAADDQGGAGVAFTEYSFNGTDWTQYSGPFALSTPGTRTLYYRSVDIMGNREATKQRVIQVDKTAPTTTDTVSGTQGLNGWYESAVQVGLAAVDDQGGSGVAGTHHTYGGQYEGTVTISAEGTTTFQYRSVDTAGNTEPTRERVIRIDRYGPTSSASMIGTSYDDGAYAPGVLVTLEAYDSPGGSGVEVLEYSFDGASWTTYVGPFALQQSATVHFRSRDVAGHVEATKQQAVTIR